VANILVTSSSQLVADVTADSPNPVTIPALEMTIQPGGARQVHARMNVGVSANVVAAFNVDLTLLFSDAGFEENDIWGKSKTGTAQAGAPA